MHNSISTCSDERSFIGTNQSVISYTFYLPNKKWSKVEAERKRLKGKGKPPVGSQLFKDAFANGIERNLRGMREHFPGWVMRLYTDVDPDESLCKMICNNDDLFWCDVRQLPGGQNMSKYFPKTWRFLAMGDPTIDLFSIRDLDSELSNREAAAIQDWLEVGKPFNLFRDFPKGHDRPILGGLWGGKNSLIGYELGKQLLNQLLERAVEQNDTKWALDQGLIGDVVYLPYETKFVAYDSYHCTKWNKSGNVRPFPTQREGNEFLGSQVLWKLNPEPPTCPEECRPTHGKHWKRC
ncbi:hypothetical protein Ocin01_17760 [Orchesella cincta]|uniref:Uncharacterized protein n=1 Tax=Orchesella cincta TaxID=48709 RepID=A0A1D2M7L2_ORCCI|nr:hypothetical protein Ocin01_17760 [Orchesella cincta]